jgi:hypothetical protein
MHSAFPALALHVVQSVLVAKSTNDDHLATLVVAALNPYGECRSRSGEPPVPLFTAPPALLLQLPVLPRVLNDKPTLRIVLTVLVKQGEAALVAGFLTDPMMKFRLLAALVLSAEPSYTTVVQRHLRDMMMDEQQSHEDRLTAISKISPSNAMHILHLR